MKEVVTLQVGSYANYIGAHFWNFQDELSGREGSPDEGEVVNDIDSGVLYRVGETLRGEATYTPRLLLFDLRGSLGSVRAAGSLYGAAPAANLSSIRTWGGAKAVYKSEPVERSLYLQSLDIEEDNGSGQSSNMHEERRGLIDRPLSNEMSPTARSESEEHSSVKGLNDGVSYWTDYLKVHLHPRSVAELGGAWQGDPLSYGAGRGLLDSGESMEEIRDRLRFFVEECDNLQGFQCILDCIGIFTAPAEKLLTVIEDEYPTVPRLSFAAKLPVAQLKNMRASRSPAEELTASITFCSLSHLSHLFVPMDLSCIGRGIRFPYLLVNDDKPYESTAVCASAIETMTTPYRLQASDRGNQGQVPLGADNMSSLVNKLATQPSANIGGAYAALPAPPVSTVAGSGRLTTNLDQLVPLSDGLCDWPPSSSLAQSLVVRGARLAGTRRAALVPQAYGALQANLSGHSIRHVTVSRQPLPIPLPFPSIVAPTVSSRGDVVSQGGPIAGQAKGGLEVLSLPALSCLSSGLEVMPIIKRRLESLEKYVSSRAGPGMSVVRDWGLEGSDIEEMRERLKSMLHSYHHDSSDE
eukprot:SM000180S03524  [mRNA]  locus=s180:94646:97522:- [translate_table: standard]